MILYSNILNFICIPFKTLIVALHYETKNIKETLHINYYVRKNNNINYSATITTALFASATN